MPTPQNARFQMAESSQQLPGHLGNMQFKCLNPCWSPATLSWDNKAKYSNRSREAMEEVMRRWAWDWESRKR